MAPRGAVGGQRLGRRPEIQAAPGAQPQQPPLRVQRHAAPSRGRYPAHVVRCVGVHRREVAVIAQGDERRGDGGVDGALGLLRGAQRDAHGLREQPARRRQAPGRVVGAHQLRIGAEPAAGAVDGVELGRQQALGLAHGGLLDHDDRGGADRLQGRRGVGGAHDPPEVTGGRRRRLLDGGRLLRGRGRRLRRRGRSRGLLLRRRRRRGRVVGLPVPALVVAGRVARRRAPRRRVEARCATWAVAFEVPGLVAAASALTLATASTATAAMTAVMWRSRRRARSRWATSSRTSERVRRTGGAIGPLSAVRVGAT